ncbi:MAG: class II aldolase/adducin family protein [Dehalococcoidia bacterium]|nr:class II aldolase/adducin family protein [Dehalococcoidia bacterium]
MDEPLTFRCIKDEVSPEEWEARKTLAACYRLVDKFGMTDLINNHITVRVPGAEHHLLINLFGLLYREMTASSLVKIDLDGDIVWKPESPYGYNRAGYVIHGAVHKARHDVKCVLHTHTRAGMAVSCMAEGLLPITQTAMRFYDRIGYHDFEGLAIDMDEQERLVLDLGDHPALVLHNHGLLTCGPGIPETFYLMYHLEMACRAQVDIMSARAEVIMPRDGVAALTARQWEDAIPWNRRGRNTAGKQAAATYNPGSADTDVSFEWPALLRMLRYESAGSPYPAYDS